MEPEAEIERVSRELAELVHRAGVPLFEVSRDIGRHPNYLSRALRGAVELKVRDLFAVLLQIHMSPRQLFLWLYPFGGEVAAKRERDPAFGARRDDSTERLLRRIEVEKGHLRRTPEDWTALVAELLRDLLRRKGLAQEAASLALGLGPRSLPQVLAGKTKLTLQHLFAVLALTGTPPGRFFLELFGAPEEDALAALQWVRYLDALEKDYPRMLAAQAAKAGRQEEPQEPRAEPGPAGAGEARPRRGPGRPTRRRR